MLLLFTVMVFFVFQISGTTACNVSEWEIQARIFQNQIETTNGYQPSARPKRNASESIEVQLRLVIMSMDLVSHFEF